MVMVLSLEMSLWVFAWDERDLHACVWRCSWIWFFSRFYWAALAFLTGSHCFYGRLDLLAMMAFCNDLAEMGLDTREE
jgi:hypothetical protein